MKYIISFILIVLFLSSCKSVDTVTLADKKVYYDSEAVIAYDIYNELYNNNLSDYRPIIFKNK